MSTLKGFGMLFCRGKGKLTAMGSRRKASRRVIAGSVTPFHHGSQKEEIATKRHKRLLCLFVAISSFCPCATLLALAFCLIEFLLTVHECARMFGKILANGRMILQEFFQLRMLGNVGRIIRKLRLL